MRRSLQAKGLGGVDLYVLIRDAIMTFRSSVSFYALERAADGKSLRLG